MSQNNESAVDWPINVIKLAVGVGLFIVLSFLLTAWELQREEVLGTATPGVAAYLLMPALVGILVIGANFVISGGFALIGMWVSSVRAGNPE